MSVYVDILPDCCACCVCNDDNWECGITREDISHDGRREDCPLIEIVRCKDCINNDANCSGEENWCYKFGYAVDDDGYCNYGEKQVTSKLNNPDDSLVTEDSEACKEQKSKLESDLMSRQAAGKTFCALCNGKRFGECEYSNTCQSLRALQSVPPVKDMGEVSDGYHTFNQLYHQRAVLFATIVNQNKDKAWKSWKHEDDKFCFDKEKEWFIVGVDTPEGSYTYHYEKKYWDMFDCEELDRGKHWDGHTEEDVKRLLSLPPVEPKIYGNEHNCIMTIFGECSYSETGCGSCAVVEKVRNALKGECPPVEPERPKGEWKCMADCGVTECDQCGWNVEEYVGNYNFCPNCGADMRGEE